MEIVFFSRRKENVKFERKNTPKSRKNPHSLNHSSFFYRWTQQLKQQSKSLAQKGGATTWRQFTR